MSNKYSVGEVVSINPNSYSNEPKQEYDNKFAALVLVKTSRYAQLEYPPELGYGSKICIKWTMETTKGNIIEKQWSTGLNWDELATLSPDGRKLVTKDVDFRGIGPNSDAMYLLQKSISSGFPADKIVDDVSVFDGTCFFIHTDRNPRAKGSSEKQYPKQYHPEGWEAARAAQVAKQQKYAAGNSQGASQTSPEAPGATKAPSPVAIPANVLKAASGALVEILGKSPNGSITRGAILKELNNLPQASTWEPSLRRDVTIVLWELPSLTTVVTTNGFKITNETVSLF